MASLIIPNEQKHKYVIGIDFGHAETSAAISTLEWGINAGQSHQLTRDIRINSSSRVNDKVMVSAISQIDDNEPFIGGDAFASCQIKDGANIRVCFKTPPMDIDGTEEQLMVKYMKIIYETIRNIETQLTDDNHVVYIARPSGWQEEEVKERYRQMALTAGIPLAGLTSESRAAIFYAKNSPSIGFAREIEQGAIVFDLGSSTLDLTYLSNNTTPIDNGYPHGASLIDKSIFQTKMISNEGINKLLENHPQYRDILLFKAREIKESIFSSPNATQIDESFTLRTIIAKECSDYDKLKKETVEVEYQDLPQMIQEIDSDVNYTECLRQDIQDFKNNYLSGLPLKGVFMTGGASRMGFVKRVIENEFQLSEKQVKIDPDDPSLTISRGIAMLGCADAITFVLCAQLEKKTHIDFDDFYHRFTESISKEAGSKIASIIDVKMHYFSQTSQDMSINDLIDLISVDIKQYCQGPIKSDINNAISNALSSQHETVVKELNRIIAYYAPGREVRYNAIKTDVQTAEIIKGLDEQINDIIDPITDELTSNLSEIVTEVIWWAVGLFLFGLIYATYRLIKWGVRRLIKDETDRIIEELEEKEKKRKETMAKKQEKKNREKALAKYKEKQNEIKQQIIEQIHDSFANNQELKKQLKPSVTLCFQKMVSENMKSVRIPIE